MTTLNLHEVVLPAGEIHASNAWAQKQAQPPVGEPITTIGNLVNVLEVKNGWARIETLAMQGPWPLPSTHPWLYNRPVRSIRVVEDGKAGKVELGNAILDRGVIYPMYSRNGQAWIEMKWLRKVAQPQPTNQPVEANVSKKMQPAPAGKIFAGKGMYLWIIYRVLGGKLGRPPSPEELADYAAQMGLTHVLIKMVDGGYLYNVHQGVDLVPPLVEALRRRGILPVGWAYVYGNVAAEVTAIVKRVRDLNLTVFVINAEKEFKAAGMAAKATELMRQLRQQLPEVALGLSTYRFPSLHAPFPYKEFLAWCDFNMPQVYWQEARNPEAQLERALKENRALANMEIVPTGSTYKEAGWQPTADEVQRFMQACMDQGLDAVNFWEWHHGFDLFPQYGEEIRAFTGLDPEPPRKDEEPDVDAPQVEEIEAWKQMYNDYGIFRRQPARMLE